MIILEMKNYNMILIERQPKHQSYHQAKLISTNILVMKKQYDLIKQQIIEQAKFTYSPLGRVFEKQTNKKKTIEDQGEKQVKALKTLKSDNKIYLIPKNALNNEEAKKELDKIKEI